MLVSLIMLPLMTEPSFITNLSALAVEGARVRRQIEAIIFLRNFIKSKRSLFNFFEIIY